MIDLPTVLAIAIPLAQGTAERQAMQQTGTAPRKRHPEWTFFAVNIPYWLLISLGVAQHIARPTRPGWAMILAGSLLAVAGVALRVVCHHQLAGGFSPYVELAPEHRLIDTGLYRTVRHPMYLGTLLMLIGLPVLLASPVAAVCAFIATVGLVFRIMKEERMLRAQLPGYADYMHRSWRLLPGVW